MELHFRILTIGVHSFSITHKKPLLFPKQGVLAWILSASFIFRKDYRKSHSCQAAQKSPCLRRSACPPQGFWRRGFAQAGRCKLSPAKSRSRERPCLRRSGYAQAGEILRVASRRIRSEFLPRRRVGEPARGVLQGTLQMGFFEQPVRYSYRATDCCTAVTISFWKLS